MSPIKRHKSNCHKSFSSSSAVLVGSLQTNYIQQNNYYVQTPVNFEHFASQIFTTTVLGAIFDQIYIRLFQPR